MGFTIGKFGNTSDGKETKTFSLTNSNGTEAVFTDLGACWTAMKVKDANGCFEDVLIGYEDPKIYENNPTSCGECVGRNANRIGGARFSINGKEYQIAANNNGINNLHSGPDYWRSRVFDAVTEETEEGSSVRFTLHSPDMDQGYPGNMDFSVRYTLKEDDALSIEYQAVCDRDTICNPTNHAYFNLGGHGSGSALNQEVWINADSFTPTDKFSIPTGEIRPVSGTPMDFNVMKPIGKEIGADYDQLKLANGYDHNYVLNKYDGNIRLVAKSKDPVSGRLMKVYTDLPGMQFYSGNYLNSQAPGKEGADYSLRSGYCFETQYYPDSVNRPEWPSPILKAGEKYHHITIYKFGV